MSFKKLIVVALTAIVCTTNLSNESMFDMQKVNAEEAENTSRITEPAICCTDSFVISDYTAINLEPSDLSDWEIQSLREKAKNWLDAYSNYETVLTTTLNEYSQLENANNKGTLEYYHLQNVEDARDVHADIVSECKEYMENIYYNGYGTRKNCLEISSFGIKVMSACSCKSQELGKTESYYVELKDALQKLSDASTVMYYYCEGRAKNAPTVAPTTTTTTTPTVATTTTPTVAPTTTTTTTPANNVQVILLSNGGNFANGSNALIKNYKAGDIQFITSADFPTKDGYVFDGFTTANGKELTYISTDNTYLYVVPENNDILTAKWKVVDTATIAPTAPATNTPVVPATMVPTTTATTVPTNGAITTPTPGAIQTATPTAVTTTTPTPTATTVPTITPTVAPTVTAEPTPVVTPTPETPNYPDITLNTSNITLGKGEKTKITVKSAQTAITYKSGNEAIATVDSNGNIVAKSKGTAFIFVTANNTTKKVKVIVKAAPSEVTVKKKTITLKKGKKATIKYSLNKGAHGKVTFTTSNKKVVSVTSKGKITAKKKGTAKINVKTYNGKKAVVKVIVK